MLFLTCVQAVVCVCNPGHMTIVNPASVFMMMTYLAVSWMIVATFQ